MARPKRAQLACNATFDIETEAWSTFCLGGFFSEAEGFQAFRDEKAFARHLLAFKGTVYGWNCGRYDTLWFLSALKKIKYDLKKVDLLLSGQRIIMLRTQELKIVDGTAILPMSLDKAAQIVDTRKRKTGLDCICEKTLRIQKFFPAYDGCGGYCAIKRDMSRANYAALTDYLQSDCVTTYNVIQKLNEIGEEANIDLKLTIGSSAFKCSTRRFGIKPALWSSPNHYFKAREGYYGGRTQCGHVYAEHGHSIDINSAYPAALANEWLPTGHYQCAEGKQAHTAFSFDMPGIYEIEVTVPKMHWPPLPVRMKGRVCYPHGEFVGHWTKTEIDHAVSVGCVVKKVLSAIFWRERKQVTKPFLEEVWHQRFINGAKSSLGTFFKLYGNSYSGKCAQHPEIEEVCYFPTMPIEELSCKSPRTCGLNCEGWCGAWEPYGDDSGFFTRPKFEMSKSAHVQWAAYLTAYARIQLHKQMIAKNDGLDVLYVDTDNVKSIIQRDWNCGENLGQWKYEGKLLWFECLAPKTYQYVDPDTGEVHARSKGIPDAERNFEGLFTGVAVDRGVQSLRTAIRSNRGLFSRRILTRQIRPDPIWIGDRLRGIGRDTKTYPPSYDQLKARFDNGTNDE